MLYRTIVFTLGVSLAAQGQPNCTGIARDVDARCACVKDPSSQLCEMVRAGFYDDRPMNTKPINLSPGNYTVPKGPPAQAQAARPQPARPATQAARAQQARVVALTHTDYLRFLQPNAQLVVGFDFGKVFSSPELVAGLLGANDGEDARNKVMGALREMDHLWMSYAGPNDVVIMMTGKFEQGVAAGMFYAQGVQPVFLGGAHAMMVGPEASLQAALARLAKPAGSGEWITRRARELARDHETWIVKQLAPGTSQGALQEIRQFALGFRLSGDAGVDGEAVAESEASAEKITAWVDEMKAGIRGKTGAGALDSLNLERAGSTVRFSAKGDALLNGEPGRSVMNSEFGVELYSIIMAGFPGVPQRTVAEDKLLAVHAGMTREEVLRLLGRPVSVYSIQGLDTPRERWTYQVPFGKELTVRMDGGVVTGPAQ